MIELVVTKNLVSKIKIEVGNKNFYKIYYNTNKGERIIIVEIFFDHTTISTRLTKTTLDDFRNIQGQLDDIKGIIKEVLIDFVSTYPMIRDDKIINQLFIGDKPVINTDVILKEVPIDEDTIDKIIEIIFNESIVSNREVISKSTFVNILKSGFKLKTLYDKNGIIKIINKLKDSGIEVDSPDEEIINYITRSDNE